MVLERTSVQSESTLGSSWRKAVHFQVVSVRLGCQGQARIKSAVEKNSEVAEDRDRLVDRMDCGDETVACPNNLAFSHTYQC